MNLATRSTEPITNESKKLSEREATDYLRELSSHWRIVNQDVPTLYAEFKFENFQAAIDFAVAVGQAAEDADHHPDIVIKWGFASIRWWTHAINGLHINDFILAARTDQIFAE